jgi:hypothetical protein
MTTGPGTVERVVVVRRVVDELTGAAVVGPTAVVAVVGGVELVPEARVRSTDPPPLQAARATNPKAVASRRTQIVSPPWTCA